MTERDFQRTVRMVLTSIESASEKGWDGEENARELWDAAATLRTVLDDLSSIPAREEGKQKHAAWCWLPKDHPGMCEGDQ